MLLSFLFITGVFCFKVNCILISRNVLIKTALGRDYEYDNWKPSFWPHPIFNWRTFSRRVTARWSRR